MRNQPPIALRPAALDDAAVMAVLSTELGYPATTETMAERLRECLADPHRMAMLAVCGAAVVGQIEVQLRRTLESGTWAEIVGLVVAQEHRGRGAGSAMVTWAMEWARARGTVRLRVRTNVVRADAAIFYARQGFRETKQARVFEMPL